MTWTLIALVMLQGWAPSQVVVPGFATKAACLTAARIYLAQLNDQTTPGGVIYRSACVSSHGTAS